MKKGLLMVLVIAALAMSCSYGLYYTELAAYDPDADFERIADGKYAYLTTMNRGIGAGEFFDVLSDLFIAAERIYVTLPMDGYPEYYRVVNEIPQVLPLVAYLEEGVNVEKLDFDAADALFLEMGEREHYTFNNVLMSMSADLGKDYALIHITPTAGGATQVFCVQGDYREKWRWYWNEISDYTEVTEVSFFSRELMNVLWYGNEFWKEESEKKSSILTCPVEFSFYNQSFPVPVNSFPHADGGGYDI